MGEVKEFIITLKPDNRNLWLSENCLTEEINGNKCLPYEIVYDEIYELVNTTFGHTGFITREEAYNDGYEYIPECTWYHPFSDNTIKQAEHILEIVENSYHVNDDDECDLLIKDTNNYDYICKFLRSINTHIDLFRINGLYVNCGDDIFKDRTLIKTFYFSDSKRKEFKDLFEAMYKGTSMYKNHTHKEYDDDFDISYQKHYDEVNNKRELIK